MGGKSGNSQDFSWDLMELMDFFIDPKKIEHLNDLKESFLDLYFPRQGDEPEPEQEKEAWKMGESSHDLRSGFPCIDPQKTWNEKWMECEEFGDLAYLPRTINVILGFKKCTSEAFFTMRQLMLRINGFSGSKYERFRMLLLHGVLKLRWKGRGNQENQLTSIWINRTQACATADTLENYWLEPKESCFGEDFSSVCWQFQVRFPIFVACVHESTIVSS